MDTLISLPTNEQSRIFREVFNINLRPEYWHPIFKFDIIKFDEKFLSCPEGKSTQDFVYETYGIRGVNILRDLLDMESLEQE